MNRHAGPAGRFGAVVISALLFAGCATLRPGAPVKAPEALPSASDLSATLQQRRDALQSLRGLARLHFRDPQESGSLRQAIIVQRPDHVRVEVLSVFGTAFLLVADGDAITAYVPNEQTVYHGPATPENLWRYTRLWLPVGKLVDIVLATPGPSSGASSSVAYDASAGTIRLQTQNADGTQAVWFDGSQKLVAAEERDTHGDVRWQAQYSNYEVRDGLPIATHIALQMPRWSRTMELDLQEVDVNAALDGALFALQPPPGSKIVQLDSEVD